jgi:hypothetical protein
VYGLSPQKDRNKIREWVGIQLQESAVSSIKDKGQIFLQPFPCKVLLQNALICDSKMPYYGQSEKILRHPLRRRLQ